MKIDLDNPAHIILFSVFIIAVQLTTACFLGMKDPNKPTWFQVGSGILCGSVFLSCIIFTITSVIMLVAKSL